MNFQELEALDRASVAEYLATLNVQELEQLCQETAKKRAILTMIDRAHFLRRSGFHIGITGIP